MGGNNLAYGAGSVALGYGNQIDDGSGMGASSGPANGLAIGAGNSIAGAQSSAFGRNNHVSQATSLAFGHNNLLQGQNTSVFGVGITNLTPNSTMIGPSDTAKVTILSSGNVGIGLGTASPTQKLDVGGNIRLSGNIINASGNTLTLPSGNGTLLTSSGNQTITGATTLQGTTTLGGATVAQQLKVDVSSGNVGIGAAPDASAKLHVAGSSKFGGEIGVGTGANTDGANLRLLASATDAQWNLDNNTGSLRFFTESAPGVGAATRMIINPNGYVGVGTTGPRNNFDVVRSSAGFGATINIRSFTGTGIVAEPTLNLVKSHGLESTPTDMGTSAYEVVGKIKMSGRYQGAERLVAGMYAYVHGTPSASATQLPGFVAFNVATEVANMGVTPIVMTSTGRVGVMNTDPQATLDVTGNAQIAGDLKMKNRAVIRVSPAGDIPMIASPVGTDPEL
jgi:hypothetical protein